MLNAIWVSLLRLIPPWVPAVLILLLTATVWWYQNSAQSWELKYTQAVGEYAGKLLKAEQRALAAEKRERDKETTWRGKFDEAQEKKDAEIKRLDGELARSGVHLQRMRDAVQIAAGALRHRAASEDPQAAALSEAGARAAELLGTCSERYRDVAAAADRAIAGGLQCQRSYQALEDTENSP